MELSYRCGDRGGRTIYLVANYTGFSAVSFLRYFYAFGVMFRLIGGFLDASVLGLIAVGDCQLSNDLHIV